MWQRRLFISSLTALPHLSLIGVVNIGARALLGIFLIWLGFNCRWGIIVFIEYQSFCPFVGIGSPPAPSPASECAPYPLGIKKGDNNHLRMRGRGVPIQTTGVWHSVYFNCGCNIMWKKRLFTSSLIIIHPAPGLENQVVWKRDI